MGRRVACACGSEENAGKEAFLRGAHLAPLTLNVVVEQRLHLIPGCWVDDGGVLTGIGFLFVFDPAKVVWIAQDRIKRTAEEMIPRTAADVMLAQPLLQADLTGVFGTK
jgi:hypothetical protein